MDVIQKQAVMVAKEIVVKFIEVGRVTPANFQEIFPVVYAQVLNALEAAPKDILAALRQDGE